ncbi:polymorphic toxin-type HINT domain-containing protein [Saccharopolyspora shandongensis]|uniref:polymorphic toxin-type HINT domain-containing protein n=1 Tax=Saccharopolyspora shandongensis TaxID=418495 RepID=UPI0033F6C74C
MSILTEDSVRSSRFGSMFRARAARVARRPLATGAVLVFVTSLLVSTGMPAQVAEAAGGPSVPLPTTSSVPVTEQNMQPRPADQAAIDALKGDQPAGTGDGKAGAGKYEATSLAPSATWDVSAHTGDFNWNYPLRVPPVPGALQPELDLSYSSGVLDGLTSATNTQAPWVGDGWSMWPGFIERSYGSCTDDLPGDADDKPADLCWRSDNATLSFGGSGSALIKDDATGVWRPENDDGSRIERLTGAANGDNDGEHWKVTDVDGVQYFYGSRTESKSTWTVPVFGDDLGEPCHASDFAASSCTQGYRWNLDKVVDPHGNVIHYFYDIATNRYGLNNNSKAVDYVRDGWLARIDYGLHTQHAAEPAARVVFDVADRCVPGAACTRDKPENWPDVPWIMECTGTTCKQEQRAPTFWSSKRLAKVTTRIWRGTGFTDVESWTLRHEFPSPGDGEKPAMWLAGITNTGHVGGNLSLPEVTFEGVPKPNRVYAVDGHAALIRYRMNAIVSESGGVLSIKYAEPECVTGVKMPSNPETNTLRCFPVTWAAPAVPKRTDYFHKYVIESVTEHDRFGSTTGAVTNYEYLDGAAWHQTTSELVPDTDRTWNEFRGFGRVRIRTGSGHDGPITLTEQRFYRGMDADPLPGGGRRNIQVSDSEDKSYPDHDWLRGFGFETTTFNGDGGPVVTKTITEPHWQGPTATRGTLKAYIVQPGVQTTYTTLEQGRRVTRSETTYDEFGLPTRINDLGDIAKPDDDLCTTTTYARNTQSWLISLPARVETMGIACGQTPSLPVDAVSDQRTSYDGHAFGAAPTVGDATRVEELENYTADGPVYTTVARSTYDAHGRVLSVADALDRTTTTSYTPQFGSPTTSIVVTNPAGHATTTTFEPAFGQPVKQVAPNQRTTEITYDPLGRRGEVWLPNRQRAKPQSANYRFTYRVIKDQPVVVTTESLNPSGSYTTSHQFYDGLLRPRQTQQAAPDGGRLLTETHYDSHGRVYRTTEPYFNDAPPDTSLWTASSTDIPALTRTEFDGAGREVAQIFLGGGIEKWRTTIAYGGDRHHVTPPEGGTATTTITDARGRMTELRQYSDPTPTGAYDATTYTHTDAGQLATVTDPGGNTWRYTYDLHGQRIKTEDPDTGTSTYGYDLAGQLASETDARATTLAYAYDNLGRKTATHNGSLDGPKLAEWTYDTALNGTGGLHAATRWIDGNAYIRRIVAYNALWDPIRTETVIPAVEGELALTYQSNFRYAPDGTLDGQTYPAVGDLAVETVSHSFSDLGLPTQTYGTTDYATSTLYTRYGETARVELGLTGKRTWLSYYYDEHTRRLYRMIADAEVPQPMQADIRYTYDPTGNITSIADQPLSTPADIQCFNYDHLRRLTEAWTPTTSCDAKPDTAALGGPAPYWQSFTYDKTGNRLAETQHVVTGNTVREYGYTGAGHTLSSVTTTAPDAPPQSSEFTYDPAGNTTRRVLADRDQTLDWGLEGHLQKVTEKDGTSTEFVYDADGQRLLRRDPTGTTLYLDGQEAHLDPTGTVVTATRYYTHAGSTIAMRETGGKLSWLAQDHQATTTLSINTDTLETTRRRYLPFGDERGPDLDFPGEKGFVGGTIDAAAGLTTLGARQYDPELGRFLSVDPVMDLTSPQQMHGYTYANNNPITFSDPSGLIMPEMYEQPRLVPPWMYDDMRLGKRSTNRVSKPKASWAKTSTRYQQSNISRSLRVSPRCQMTGTGCGGAPPRSLSDAEMKAVVHGLLDFGGLLPGIGAVFDLASCALYASEGQAADAAFSCAAAIPVAGDIATGAKLVKNGVNSVPAPMARPQQIPCVPNSFVPGTLVLMADGSQKPIEDVDVGDQVLATDPETGETAARPVIATITGEGEKNLVEITVDTDSDKGNATGVVVATDEHPFWVEDQGRWLSAEDLAPGADLRSVDGRVIEVVSTLERVEIATVHNLTIDDIHTYYIVVARTPVLSHNAACASLPSDGSSEFAVIGRRDDTKIAMGWENHEVLALPKRVWGEDANDAWIQGIIDRKQKVYVASPVEGNMLGKGGETVFARELRQLQQAGYVWSGNYLIPPG